MIRVTCQIDKVWGRSLIEAQTEVVSVLAGMMLSQLNNLLGNAAQRSGNYVANFRITVNGEGGAFDQNFDYRPRRDWFAAGFTEAIAAAKRGNSGVQALARFAGSFSPGSAIVALENEVEYAEDVEAQQGRPAGSGYPGDPGNPNSAGAVGEFAAAVTGLTSRRIYVGKGTWQMYRDYDNV